VVKKNNILLTGLVQSVSFLPQNQKTCIVFKRKQRKNELGGYLGIGNYEVKTRLRKSQAGL